MTITAKQRRGSFDSGSSSQGGASIPVFQEHIVSASSSTQELSSLNCFQEVLNQMSLDRL